MAIFIEQEKINAALADIGDAIDLTSIPHEDIYKAVYNAKITAYKAV